jgi:ribosome-binding factor A
MFARNDRLKELIKSEIILALRTVKDPGVAGFLTVTDVELSPDRKTATVFYSVMGQDAQRASTTRALTRAEPYLRGVLRKRLALKVIPKVVFRYDDTPRKASRVEELLEKIRRDDAQG